MPYLNRHGEPRSLEREANLIIQNQMRRHISRLQEYVDSQADDFISTLKADNADEAQYLRERFNAYWFSHCLYSPKIRAKVAERLVVAVGDYPFIDTSVWRKIVARAERLG